VQPRASASVSSCVRPPLLCASLRVVVTCLEAMLIYVLSLLDNPLAEQPLLECLRRLVLTRFAPCVSLDVLRRRASPPRASAPSSLLAPNTPTSASRSDSIIYISALPLQPRAPRLCTRLLSDASLSRVIFRPIYLARRACSLLRL
jgi:hypothetical protein